eukprot:TRINITY_DN18285_c0_g1_i4.p1 TRINITY_DN18285_c0_g1~~TRINITY_DN18285_c0_g1_i4.p1  ORF type:complete len:103 (+),score=9.97 TRINITY_DN18285_c0_g1_i4:836-1144(+)
MEPSLPMVGIETDKQDHPSPSMGDQDIVISIVILLNVQSQGLRILHIVNQDHMLLFWGTQRTFALLQLDKPNNIQTATLSMTKAAALRKQEQCHKIIVMQPL